jgi:ABC-type dipeptide/oligopeptide/nickel transport system permease component
LTTTMISLSLLITGFLCLLNGAFAYIFRKRRTGEVLSYLAVGLIELAIFVFVLLLRLRILTSIPYPLPPGLSFNRAELGAALAIGIGLFPAAYWHRTSIAQWRERMARDAKALKEQDSGVHVRKNAPGEWMN